MDLATLSPVAFDDPTAPGRPLRRQDALGNKLLNPVEELALIEKELVDLRVAFDQYLLGLNRRSPVRRRDRLAERLRKLKAGGLLRGTALRFQLDQLQSKFQSYDRMWVRSLQEREDGTYRADQFKLRLKGRLNDEPSTPTAPPAAPEPAAGVSDGQVRALYESLVAARKRTGEPTEGLTVEGLGKSLRRQVPVLLEKNGCRSVDFKIVIKDGKALLKALPRK